MIRFKNYYGKSKKYPLGIFYFEDDNTGEEFRGTIGTDSTITITKNDKPYINSKDNNLVKTKKRIKMNLIEKMLVDLSIAIEMIESDQPL